MKPKIKYIILISFFTYFIFCIPNKLFEDQYSIVINDKDGNLLNAKIATDGQWRFPIKDTIPLRYKTCLIHFEDKRFYNHMGVDFLSFAEALKVNIKAGNVKRGGSTITMQLMRLCRKKKKRNVFNKVLEMTMALRYELTHSKEDIINTYAAHAPFGSNVVGLEAASWRYFGKKTSSLSWAESALLAVLPNSPSLIHLGKNRDALITKRNRLLKSLMDKNIISKDEYNLAILENIPPKPFDLPSVTPHLLASINKMDNTSKQSNTTVDRALQAMAAEVLDMHYQINMQEEISNGAILILDTQSGNVLAYAGNTTAPNEKYVDMIMAKRSSGSLLKPILFAAQQDAGQLVPQQLLNDIPINLNGFSPQNFDEKFRGAIKAEDALAQSLNIPFVLSLKEYGTQKFIHNLSKLQITSIDKPESHYGLSLILGGAEVNLWEMCGAYAYMGRTLGNYQKYEGKYNAKDLHTSRIYKNENDEEFTKKDLTFEYPIMSAGAIFTTFEALSKLQRPDENGNWQFFNSASKIAWKTGTSFGHKDAWAIGVTPKYTIGVWIGNASGEGRAGLTGATKAAPVLFDIFNRLPYITWFQTPWDALQKVSICKHSGHIASSICNEVDTTYISASSQSNIICPYHKNIYTDKENNFRVSKHCCDCEGKISSWFELPATVAHYYKSYHPEYKSLPPFSAECTDGSNNSSKAIDVIYPAPLAKVFIPKNLASKKEKVVASAAASSSNATLFWHLDNEFIGLTKNQHTLEINGSEGEHKLSITDEFGNKVVRKFWIVND